MMMNSQYDGPLQSFILCVELKCKLSASTLEHYLTLYLVSVLCE